MGELAAKCCPSIQPGPVIRYGVLSPPYRKWDWGQRRDLGGDCGGPVCVPEQPLLFHIPGL